MGLGEEFEEGTSLRYKNLKKKFSWRLLAAKRGIIRERKLEDGRRERMPIPRPEVLSAKGFILQITEQRSRPV